MIAPRLGERVIDDEGRYIGPLAHASQARFAELGTVGHDNGAIGSSHHAAFGFHEQHVAVEETFGVHSGNAQKRLLNVDRLEHVIGKWSVGNTGPVMDRAAEENQVDRVLGRKEVRDRERVGHDLQRAANELTSQFIGGATAVEQQRFVIFHQGGCRHCDPSFFIPRLIIVGPLTLELPHRRAGAGKEDAAVGPFGFAGFFEGLQIAADGRFADIHRGSQVGYGNEAMLANQIAQLGPPGRRTLERIGRNHSQVDVFASSWLYL